MPKPIVKKLLLADVMSEEVKAAHESNGERGKSIVNNVIAGAIVKRDDNSRQMPGKKDSKRLMANKSKRVLNGNLRNLFGKFQSEQSDVKISFTTFCRMRPKEFNLTQYISRNRCLCQKHQNMALLLKSVKAAGANVPLNPEDFIKRVQNNDINANEIMTGVKDDKVSYEQWKRVDCEDGKKRMKIVQHQVSRDELAAFFIKQTCEFQEHTRGIKELYKAMSDLKHGLPPNHVIVQNFTCVSADEVQSAYWNQNSITLHPVVAYYKNDEGTLNHYSYIIVSDDLGHSSGSVFAFIQKLLPQMREDIPNIKHIHY